MLMENVKKRTLLTTYLSCWDCALGRGILAAFHWDSNLQNTPPEDWKNMEQNYSTHSTVNLEGQAKQLSYSHFFLNNKLIIL